MTPLTLKPALSRFTAITAFALLIIPSLAAQNSGRGFVKAQAGTTLSDFPSGLTAGGGFGVRLTSSLDLFAEAGTVRNVCEYALVGARFTMPLRSIVTPFFELGGGFGHLASPHRTLPDDPSSSALLLTASGGVHLAISRRFGLDVAYRYFRVSSSVPAGPPGQLYVGIVYRF